MSDVDVVVVGAGPAGTSAAICLAEAGARVVLLDRARFPRDKACAEYLNPGAVALLERLGLLDAAREAGAACFRGMRLVSPGGIEVLLDFAADGRHAFGLSRRRLDALAVDRCRALGVQVLEGTHARELLHERGAVTGVRATRDRERLDITARLVIGADGHHSTVARLLGLERRVPWPRRIGLAAHLEGFSLQGGFGELHVGRGGYCGIAPQEEGRVNVAMVVDLARFERRSGTPEAFFDTELWRYPRLSGRAVAARRVSPVRGVGPLAQRAWRASGDGVLLAGDAAGFFDPITGEGIVDALRGGILAADAALAALQHGDTSAAGLAGYERSRAAVFGNKRRAAWLVQGFVCAPWLLDYAATRLAARSRERAMLTGVLGDMIDAGAVLAPGFLWNVLRP